MLIQSNILTVPMLHQAMRAAKIDGVYIDVRRSGRGRSTVYSHDVTLYADPGFDAEGAKRRYGKNGQRGDYDGYKAATYREHGWWMVRLFARDRDARISGYRGVADFHAQTKGAFRGKRVNPQ